MQWRLLRASVARDAVADAHEAEEGCACACSVALLIFTCGCCLLILRRARIIVHSGVGFVHGALCCERIEHFLALLCTRLYHSAVARASLCLLPLTPHRAAHQHVCGRCARCTHPFCSSSDAAAMIRMRELPAVPTTHPHAYLVRGAPAGSLGFRQHCKGTLRLFVSFWHAPIASKLSATKSEVALGPVT